MTHICLNKKKKKKRKNEKTNLMACELKKKKGMRKWSTGFNAIERSGKMKTEKFLLGLAIYRSLINLARVTISVE